MTVIRWWFGPFLMLASCAQPRSPPSVTSARTGGAPPPATFVRGHAPHRPTPVQRDDEPRLSGIVQLTFGGENAEAYFGPDARELIFQSTRDELECDQIFRMSVSGENVRRVSVGGGRTTCGYIQTDGSIVYASTHGHGSGCLQKPDYRHGYVWPLYPEMDIWRAEADGSGAEPLFATDGYDAEATVCHRDGRIVFTSTRDGDLDLYVMDRDGKNVRRMTDTPGYDGGAFFSADCRYIVWRASRPVGAALEAYRALLRRNLVKPSALEIFVMKADGTERRQVTRNGAANFAPYMHPDDRRIIFASNLEDPRGRNFDLYLIGVDGSGLERITRNPTFDSFPMFSHDGKRIVFASNRGNARRGETNVFTADWVEMPAAAAP